MRLRSNPFGFATRHPDEGVSPIPGDEQSAGRFAHPIDPAQRSEAKRRWIVRLENEPSEAKRSLASFS